VGECYRVEEMWRVSVAKQQRRQHVKTLFTIDVMPQTDKQLTHTHTCTDTHTDTLSVNLYISLLSH